MVFNSSSDVASDLKSARAKCSHLAKIKFRSKACSLRVSKHCVRAFIYKRIKQCDKCAHSTLADVNMQGYSELRKSPIHHIFLLALLLLFIVTNEIQAR